MNTVICNTDDGFYPEDVAEICREAADGAATLELLDGRCIQVKQVRIAFKRRQFMPVKDVDEFKTGKWYNIEDGSTFNWGI